MAIAAVGLIMPATSQPQAASAATCAAQVTGTVLNQQGSAPKNVTLRLSAVNDAGDPNVWITTPNSAGRFTFVKDEFGYNSCVLGGQKYRITVSSDPWQTKWYGFERTIWTGDVAKSGKTTLKLTAKQDGRIKTTTKGGSSLRSPAYTVTNASGKVVAKTKAAPRNAGPGTVDYVIVPPGTYKITMTPSSADMITPVGARTKTVTVKPGQTAWKAFAIKPGGMLSGRVTNPVGSITSATDDPPGEKDGLGGVSGWAPAGSDETWGCANLDQSAGVVTLTRSGKPFKRAACLTKSGSFKLGSLPAGKYTLYIRHHSPGLEKGQYLTKNGKKRYFTVTAGKTTSVGSVSLRAKRAMVRGTLTFPKVAHLQCVVNLVTPSGKNRTAGFHTAVYNTAKNTKVSYRVWAKSASKAKYKVRYTCYNDLWYSGRWGYPAETPLSTHARWYSGGGTSLSKAKTVTASATRPGKMNATIKGSKSVSAGTPRITGTPKVGQTLRVTVPRLGKGARYVVRWIVNGKVFDANPCDAERDCYFTDKRSFKLTAKYKGSSIKAQVLLSQSTRWTKVKTTKAVTVR